MQGAAQSSVLIFRHRKKRVKHTTYNKKTVQDLRQRIKEQRRALSLAEVNALSQQVYAQVAKHPFLQTPRTIASYLSCAGEIATTEINSFLGSLGHHLCLPVIDPEIKGQMEFYRYNEGDTLYPNRYAILEPAVTPQSHVAPDLLEVVLVPLVAFNTKGDRVGMGGGYYDRLLKKISISCITIGLAYDFQMVPNLSCQQWDMPLDEIITPTQHYICNSKYSALAPTSSTSR